MVTVTLDAKSFKKIDKVQAYLDQAINARLIDGCEIELSPRRYNTVASNDPIIGEFILSGILYVLAN